MNPAPFRVLDLFSGIGGFSLGLERTGGFETVAFCEIEPFPRRVLAKHWPGIPIYEDVRTLTADTLARNGIGVDVICGGFPCQDISLAGKGAGIDGERSGLWSEYARLVGELRPRFVIVENVAALLGRGLDRVLRDLAALGFDAEWHCIPASAVGAPHRRDRLWIVAYPQRCRSVSISRDMDGGGPPPSGERATQATIPVGRREDVADADLLRLEGWLRLGLRECAGRGRRQGTSEAVVRAGLADAGWWRTEPDVGRVAHGVPSRAHRLRALGNAVVPQLPELIGRAILALEAAA
jgi:DNA (cytosine-5)-methyltransferase 1